MMSTGTITWSDYLSAVAVGDGIKVAMPDQAEAFLAILSDHQRLLYQIIRTHCPDPADWRDLEQDIILQLWRSYPNYDPSFSLRYRPILTDERRTGLESLAHSVRFCCIAHVFCLADE